MLMPFSGQTNILWNHYIYDIIIPIVQGVKTAGRTEIVNGVEVRVGGGLVGKTAAAMKGIASKRRQLFYGYVVPALLFGLIARRRLPEDEKEVFLDLLMYPFGMVPLLGRIVQASISGRQYEGSYDPTMLGILGRAVSNTFDAARKQATGEKSPDIWDAHEIRKAVGIVAGIPEWPTRVMFNFAEEAFKDDTTEKRTFMEIIGMGVQARERPEWMSKDDWNMIQRIQKEASKY